MEVDMKVGGTSMEMITRYNYYNAHPEGKRVSDCVKRAITLVAKMDYHQVQLELNRYKKITGAKTYNESKNCSAYVENVLHMKKLSFPAERGVARMNGYSFAKSFPKGRYILNMAHHWTACVDGVIYDTWDCREKCVYTAYELRSDEELQKVLALEEEARLNAEKEKKAKELKKAQIKKIKEKYAKKIKPLQKKIKDLEKLMTKEIALLEER